jgi:hypothetical protein
MKVFLIASLLVYVQSTLAFDSSIKLSGFVVNDEETVHQLAEVAQMVIANDTKEVEMVEFNDGNIFYGEEITGWAWQANQKPTIVVPVNNSLTGKPSLKDYFDSNWNDNIIKVPTDVDLGKIIIDMNGRFGGDGSGGG